MRVELKSEQALNHFYKLSMSWPRFSVADRKMGINTILGTGKPKYRERMAYDYCKKNDMPCNCMETAMEALTAFDIKAHGAILNPFNVEVVSSNFEEKATNTFKEVLTTAKEKEFYEIVGECSGVFVFKETIALYYVSHCGVYVSAFPRNGETSVGKYRYMFGTQRVCDIMDELARSERITMEMLPIVVLLFKKLVPIETQEIANGERQEPIEKGKEIIENRLPFSIRHTNCTWYTEYVREEGFAVKGFWRWQACGARHAEHKWVYIAPFERKGYHRKAQKEVRAA